jgi:hypothetical protein
MSKKEKEEQKILMNAAFDKMLAKYFSGQKEDNSKETENEIRERTNLQSIPQESHK